MTELLIRMKEANVGMHDAFRLNRRESQDVVTVAGQRAFPYLEQPEREKNRTRIAGLYAVHLAGENREAAARCDGGSCRET